MVDIVYRFEADNPHEHPSPATPEDARRRLEDGNDAFANALARGGLETTPPLIHQFDLADLGLGDGSSHGPKQEPFAAVLGCSDARVPTELVFSQACNDLFVVRVAGNVLGSECLGSINYAMEHLHGSLRLLVVLGHTGCGAVSAAVDSFLTPGNYLELVTNHSLRSVVDRISIGVRGAARALETAHGADVVNRPGYRKALVETTVVVHAALTAHTLKLEFEGHADCDVAFGVYDLATYRVGLPTGRSGATESLLTPPPHDQASFAELMTRIVTGASLCGILDGTR